MSFKLKLILLYTVSTILSVSLIAYLAVFNIQKLLKDYVYNYLDYQSKPVIDYYYIYSNSLVKEARDIVGDIASRDTAAIAFDKNKKPLAIGYFLQDPDKKALDLNEYYTKIFFSRKEGTVEVDGKEYAFITKRVKDIYLVILGKLSDIEDLIRSFVVKVLFFTFFITIVFIIVIYIVLTKLLKPLYLVTDISKKIYEGSTDIKIPKPSSSDEFGILMKAFSDMVNKLNKTIEVQKSFIADASHEFKTPLSYIKAEIELILTGAYSQNDIYKALKNIYKQIEVLNRFTEDLLALARLESNIPLKKEKTRLKDIINNTLNSLNKDILLRVKNICKIEKEIIADRHYLQIALKNLIENAYKYAPNSPIEIGCYENCIFVRDYGPGIKEEDRQKIFERFYRSEKDERGLGLGLAIVKAIAEAHGFSVKLDSTEGKGSTFFICF